MSTFHEQEIHLEQESLYCEVADTFTHALPVLDISFPKVSGRFTDRSRQNRQSKSRPGHKMPRSGGQGSLTCYLPGALVDTATGALVANWAHLLLVASLGGGDLTAVGGVAGATATATAITNATGTRPRGHIMRFGIQLDGRALGQAAVIGNPNTALLTALPAAPNATDVIRACLMSFLDTDAAPTSWRILMGFREENMQYAAHGVVFMPPQISIVHGEAPTITFPFMYGYWRELPTAIPSNKTLLDCDPAISAGGSYFIQNVGTATRPTEEKFSAIELTLNGTLIPQTGQGGRFGALQHVVGFARSKSSPDDPIGTLRLVYPWDDARPVEYDSDGSDTIHKHFLATLSAGGGTADSEGRHVAFYIPDMYPIGERPADTDWNSLPYQTAMYAITDGPDTTNNLTRSPLRIGLC